jgi:hypothetical protein
MRLRAIVVALLCPALAAAIDVRPMGIHSDGTWLRDRRGRVVLLRGMNYSGLEFGNFPGAPHGPEEADFAQMERSTAATSVTSSTRSSAGRVATTSRS